MILQNYTFPVMSQTTFSLDSLPASKNSQVELNDFLKANLPISYIFPQLR